MRYIFFLSLLLFFVSGCASTNSNHITRSSKESSFSTGTRSTNFSFDNNALSGSTKIQYHVNAHCSGPNCIPKEARLSFTIETGANDTYLDNRDLTIHAGSEKYHWDGMQSWPNIYNTSPVVHEITAVTMERDKLQQIASAKKVNGILAGHSFKWTYENREPLRKLINSMKSTEAQKD